MRDTSPPGRALSPGPGASPSPEEWKATEELRAKGISPSKHSPLLVLAHLANLETPITVGELARVTGIHRASLYRTMESLAAEGWVNSSGQPRRYVLTHRLAQLGLRALRHNHVRQALLPFATDLALRLRTPTNIAFYEDGYAIVTDSIAIQGDVPVSFPEGIRLPASCTGPGKILLASQSAKEIERVLRRPVPKFTERTRTDPKDIHADLETARELGYGWAFGEYGHRLGTVGVAVHDRSGAVAGCIGFVVAQRHQSPPREWIETAREVCDSASAHLGYLSSYFAT